jgi:alanine racemase
MPERRPSHDPAVPVLRPTRAEIDLDALRRNLARLRRVTGGTPVWAVVKADAYGHGAVPVARALAAEPGVLGVAVSLVEEGLELRAAGHRGEILILGATPAGAHAEVLAHGLTPVVSELGELERYHQVAATAGRRAGVHVKIDSGMHRLGVSPAATLALAQAIRRADALEVTGLCTHLACADVPGGQGDDATRHQLDVFGQACRDLAGHGIAPSMVHVANSAGAVRFPEARADAVRPGILLYGGGPDAQALGLEPVMRLVSEIAQGRQVPAGVGVSYGWRGHARTDRDWSDLATVPIGYADGYPRRANLPENAMPARALVRGQRVPVVGTVCMDMVMVDVSDVPGAGLGDEVVLLGPQGGAGIGLGELAGWAGVIDYEITCGISKRVPRVYKGAP